MMMMNRADFRFFLNNAGYCTPPGRAACALSLARAEAYAEAMGWEFCWEYDECFYGYCNEWLGCQDDCKKEHEVLFCLLKDADGTMLQCLGGIADADRNYRRVIEAELAAEALASLPASTFGIGKAA
jgi:hypothetical protein